MYAATQRTIAIALSGLCLLTSGCATQQELIDSHDEVRALREERTQLKKENAGLRLQNQSYEVQLADASDQLASASTMPASSPTSANYAELDALGIDYGTTQGGNFVISIPSSITFGSGKAELTSAGKNALRSVARTLKSDYANASYSIEGHTDSDPIRKSKWESNRALSLARATAVLYALVESAGVEDSQCVVVGHGEYAPLASNSDKAGKARNRRVEIVVTH